MTRYMFISGTGKGWDEARMNAVHEFSSLDEARAERAWLISDGQECGNIAEFEADDEPITSPNPLDYECPVCEALAGKYCSVPGSRGRRQVPWVHPVRETIARAHALGTDNDEESAP
jgi:hypothetical protein